MTRAENVEWAAALYRLGAEPINKAGAELMSVLEGIV